METSKTTTEDEPIFDFLTAKDLEELKEGANRLTELFEVKDRWEQVISMKQVFNVDD